LVADGDTLVEPLAAVEVKPPGLIAMLVAPLVTQLRVLLVPAVMLEGLAMNDVIVGFAPPDAVTVTVAALVTVSAPLLAVSVYTVVADGDTMVEPLAAVEVNPPGLMAIPVAPLVTQLRVLLAPAVMLEGLAINEVMVGFGPPDAVTVIVAALVTAPLPLVAVSVYAVVVDGETVVEPLAAVDVNPPGLIAMLVAPLVRQLRVLLVPALMLEGFAENSPIVGAVSGFAAGGLVTPEQLAKSMSKTTRARRARKWSCREARSASRLEMLQRLSCSLLAHAAMTRRLRALGVGYYWSRGQDWNTGAGVLGRRRNMNNFDK
jgi:hypothetical protein